MYRISILLVLLFASLILCEQVYTREFQLTVEIEDFDDREDAMNTYIRLWEEGAEFSTNSFTVSNSIRHETSYRDISDCGESGFIRKRVYVDGDLAGLVTLDIKSFGSLSLAEAEAEPFAPANEYENSSTEFIEYDVHPCEADYTANTRINLDVDPNLETCADLDIFFPEAFSASDERIDSDLDLEGYTFTSFWQGDYLDNLVTLDLTVLYENLEDAQNDFNPRSSEFSFTMYADRDFSQEQTEMGIQIYEHLLERVGPDSYPCQDGTTVDDFFEIEGNDDDGQSSGDIDDGGDDSKSSSTIVSVWLMALLSAILM